MPPEEQGPGRAELDEMGKKAITALLDSKPELQESLDKSPGYAVVNMNITKIPVVGSGAGYGIVIDQRTNTRSYIKVSQFDVGGGLGAEKFKVVIIFSDENLVDRLAKGAWHYEVGADAAAGSGSADTGKSKSGKDEGYQAFKLAESGVSVRLTVRVARATPYLTD